MGSVGRLVILVVYLAINEIKLTGGGMWLVRARIRLSHWEFRRRFRFRKGDVL